MSYDVLAFDPQATTDEGFSEWWDAQGEWSEDHSYDDPAITTPALRVFYRALIAEFPPLNGPDAPTDVLIDADPELEARLADYTFGRYLVYGCASWSQAGDFLAAFLRLGAIHGVAVAAVSDTGTPIHRPPIA